MTREGSVRIDGRLTTNFRLADDIVKNVEADVLVDRLDATTARYKMEIGPDKTKYDKQPKQLPKRVNEPRHDKTNTMSVRPAKTQISLVIRPVFAVRLMGS